MKQRSYAHEAQFDALEQFYKERYPELFTQLSAWAAVRAHTPAVFENVDATMHHYYRGAVIAIYALEASVPKTERFSDLSPRYSAHVAELDMIDTESWLLAMRASTVKQTEQLRGFIEHDYHWINEPEYLKTAMHIGAQYAYILMTHNRHCIEREQEIAWMTRDDESFEGWLEYKATGGL